ncbi:MFS transporter [Actinomadura miaoliensis]|uniref:MFS transporter n=1 Tax=Actinomadura miaoliensis TaxID=430685 RepID=A0ABP7VJS8_9ACTN
MATESARNPTAADPVTFTRDRRYLRSLLLMLAGASFFQGYDNQIFALLLSDIQSDFRVGESTLGAINIVSELGTFAAFFVARGSDRFGRRALLLWSVAGYTLFTALTALSWDVWSFASMQFLARVFVGTEYAVSVTIIVEEFPARRRGRALGVLLAAGAFGSVVVAGLLGSGLQDGPLGWRTFYLMGLVPLVVLGVYRRRLRETERFAALQAARAARAEQTARVKRADPSFLLPWQPRYRRPLVLVGLVYVFTAIPHYGATAWWAFYAERERGYGSGEISFFVICAYGLGIVGYLLCGRAMERFGRRPTALVYAAGALVSTAVLFQVGDKRLAFALVVLSVVFGLGIRPVLGAFATELFPTEIRGQTAAWIRNVFEIVGTTAGPAVVGLLGDHTIGAIGTIGDTVTAVVLLYLPVIWLIWRYMPETRGRLHEDRLVTRS